MAATTRTIILAEQRLRTRPSRRRPRHQTTCARLISTRSRPTSTTSRRRRRGLRPPRRGAASTRI